MSKEIIIIGVVIIALAHFTNVTEAEYSCYHCMFESCQYLHKIQQCDNASDICATVFEKYLISATGCYSQMPEFLQQHCVDAQNPECEICIGHLCNTKGRKDFKCITCTSDETPYCRTDVLKLEPIVCDAPTAIMPYCYKRHLTNGTIQRGCLVHENEQQLCHKDENCKLSWDNDIDLDLDADYQDFSGRDSATPLKISTMETRWLMLSIIVPITYLQIK